MAGRANKLADGYVRVTLRDEIEAGARRVRRRLTALASGVKEIGRQTAIVGAVMAAAFIPAIATAANFEDGMAAVKAVTGATADEFDRLNKAAKDLGASTSFSAIEVTQAERFLGMAGFNPDEIIEALPSTLNLARTDPDVSLGQAADIGSDVLSAFQLPIDQFQRVADVIATTAASANTSVGMMGETFKFAAPAAAAAGQAIEEMATAAGLLGNSGIKASSAGTDLKNILTVLARSTELAGVKTRDANNEMRPLLDIMRELGSATSAMSGAERLAFMIEKFGKISGKSAIILASANGQIDELRAKLANAEGSAASMAAIMDDTLGGSFRGLMSAVEGFGIAVGSSISAPVRSFVDRLAAMTRAAIEFINANPQVVQAVAAVAAGTLAAGTTLLGMGLAFQAASFSVGGLITAARGVLLPLRAVALLATALPALLALVASPVGLLAGSLALFTGLTVGQDLFSGVTESAARAWSGVKDIGVSSYGAIVDAVKRGDLQAAFGIGLATVKAMWAEVKAAFVPQWVAVTSAIEDTWTATTTLLSDAWDGFAEVFGATADYIAKAWQTLVGLITGNTGADAVVLSWNDVVFGLSEVFLRIWFGWKKMWERMKDTAANAIAGIKSAFARMAEALGIEVTETRKGAKTEFGTGGQASAPEQSLDDRLNQIEQDKQAALAALDEDRERKHAEQQDKQNAAAEDAETERQDARFELDLTVVDTEIEAAGRKAQALQDRLTELEAQPVTAEVTAETADVRAQLATVTSELDQLQGQRADLVAPRVAEVDTQITETQTQVDQLGTEATRRELTGRRETVSETITEALYVGAASEEQFAGMYAELAELDAQLAALDDMEASPLVTLDADALTQQYHAARQQLADLQAQRDALANDPIEAAKLAREADRQERFTAADETVNESRERMRQLDQALGRIGKAAYASGEEVTADTVDEQTGLTFAGIRQEKVQVAATLEKAELDRELASPDAPEATGPDPQDLIDPETGKTLRQLQSELDAALESDPYAGFDTQQIERDFGLKSGTSDGAQGIPDLVANLARSGGESTTTFSGAAAGRTGVTTAFQKLEQVANRQEQLLGKIEAHTRGIDQLGTEWD